MEQPEESKGRQMFRLQVDKPLPGDWASTCLNNIKLFKFDLLFEKIRQITKQKYIVLLKEQISMVALKYLLEKQGKKLRSNFMFRNDRISPPVQQVLENRRKMELIWN